MSSIYLTGYTIFMKYLGIDYGSKRVGTALSDEAGGIAFPRGELPNDDHLLQQLNKVISEERVTHIVVGDTRASGGLENRLTKQAELFMKELAQISGKPVSPVSELWSSVEASGHAPPGHEHDNAAAAAFILQRYLDMRAPGVG